MGLSHRSKQRPAIRSLVFSGLMLAVPALSAAPLPANVPKGGIIAFVPDPDSREYRDENGLRSWLAERGWAICDGRDGTPDLHNRMLLGTEQPEAAGQQLGSRTHSHRLRGETGQTRGRDRKFASGFAFIMRIPEENHRHGLDTNSESAEHLPLSTRVLFIMKR